MLMIVCPNVSVSADWFLLFLIYVAS